MKTLTILSERCKESILFKCSYYDLRYELTVETHTQTEQNLSVL